MDFVAAASVGSMAQGWGLRVVDLHLEVPFEINTRTTP